MNQEPKKYFVLAYYHFTSIADPHAEVARHKAFFERRDIAGRIYISHEGINGQMSGLDVHAEEYMTWLRSDERFKDVEFKIHLHHEQAFPRATVKFREQLVAMDVPADPKDGGVHLSAEEWSEMIEQRDEETVLLDVRNDYEWEIGHFEGAELPTLEMFRQFPQYAKKLREQRDPKKTKVMMYCTGGIRCELYSVLLKNEGFEQVYQLQGGVIKYGLEKGNKHWKGKLFVFDDRLAVPISDQEPAETISQCHHCGTPCDTYYNCANMDCNELFISCSSCAEKSAGCCSEVCQGAPRVRPFQKDPKPFRRWYHYESNCSCGKSSRGSASESQAGQQSAQV